MEKNEKIITLTESEFNRICKGGDTSTIFTPEEFSESVSIKIANSRLDILQGGQKILENADSNDSDFKTDFEKVKNEYLNILKNRPEQSKYIFNILEYLGEIDSVSFLLLGEINNVLENYSPQGPSSEQVNDIANLMISIEVFVKYIQEFAKGYRASFSDPNFDFRILDSTAINLRNSICNVIQELLEINPEIKQSEIFRFLDAKFCPDSFSAYKTRLENQSFWQKIKGKVRDISRAIYSHGITHSIYGLWQNTFTKKLAETINFLNRNYYTIYFVLVFTSNLGISEIKNLVSMKYDFIDILMVLGNAACLTVKDPLVLGGIVKWLSQKLLATTTFNVLSDKIYKSFGIILGNAVAYLGPVFLSNRIKNTIEYFINLACYLSTTTTGIAIRLGKYAYSGASRIVSVLYTELKNVDSINTLGIALENWWGIISTEGTAEISRMFVDILGGGLKGILEYFYNLSVNTVKNVSERVSEGYKDISKGVSESLQFSWKFTNTKFNDIYSYLSSFVKAEKSRGKGIPFYGISSREFFTGICLSSDCIPQENMFEMGQRLLKKYSAELAQIIQSINNYGLVCSNYLSNYLSEIVSGFNTIFKTCINKFYEFLELIKAVLGLFYFTTESYKEIRYGNSVGVIDELESKVIELQRKENYKETQLKVKNLLLASRKRKRF
jgi:hypothetical protein